MTFKLEKIQSCSQECVFWCGRSGWVPFSGGFYAYVIHYFYNSKTRGERPKQTPDSDSTSKNT